jgi:Raf kinase inhibitor-like YbhB/YbcL family protein
MRKLFCLLSGLLSGLLSLSMMVPAYSDTFTLNSTSFIGLSKLAAVYTCDGKDISPELDWSNVPGKTQSLALVLSDPDAPSGTFYHWVVYNIEKNVTALPEDISAHPVKMLTAENSWGRKKYNGPCPPKDATHNYIFTLYALNTTLNLPADADAKTLLAAMQNHIVGTTELKAIYRH